VLRGESTWSYLYLRMIPPLVEAGYRQDWGGLLGLRMIAEQPDWFDRVVIGDTALPASKPMGDGFMMWQRMSHDMETVSIGV